jgi:hypothetical protein
MRTRNITAMITRGLGLAVPLAGSTTAITVSPSRSASGAAGLVEALDGSTQVELFTTTSSSRSLITYRNW